MSHLWVKIEDCSAWATNYYALVYGPLFGVLIVSLLLHWTLGMSRHIPCFGVCNCLVRGLSLQFWWAIFSNLGQLLLAAQLFQAVCGPKVALRLAGRQIFAALMFIFIKILLAICLSLDVNNICVDTIRSPLELDRSEFGWRAKTCRSRKAHFLETFLTLSYCFDSMFRLRFIQLFVAFLSRHEVALNLSLAHT